MAKKLEPIVDDSLKAYLDEIGRYPLLTPEEEKVLFKQYSEVDDEESKKRIRDRIINSNLRLVVSNAKSFQEFGVPLLDLIQEGNVGLTKAVDKFDYTLGYKFSTYATWWIKREILVSINKYISQIRLPKNAYDKLCKIKEFEDEFCKKNDRYPTNKEIADGLDIDMSEHDVSNLLLMSKSVESLEEPIGDDGESFLSDLIADDINLPPEEIEIRNALREQLLIALNGLSSAQAKAISLRFGIEDGISRTLEEVAKELNTTTENARKLVNAGLFNLRFAQNGDILRDFL